MSPRRNNRIFLFMALLWVGFGLTGCSKEPVKPLTHDELFGVFAGPGRDGRTIRIVLNRNMTYAFCLEKDCMTGAFKFYKIEGDIALFNVLPGEIETEFTMSATNHPDAPIKRPASIYAFGARRCEDGKPCFDFRWRDMPGGLLLSKVQDY